MKRINTQGITYLEPLEGSSKWYWGTDYIHGDLYEAEELFQKGGRVKSNRLVFVRYPEGSLIEPIPPVDGQYFGRPIYIDHQIMILSVDFVGQEINLIQYDDASRQSTLFTSIPLTAVKDCYNLLLQRDPLMLTRRGNENKFEIIYPEKAEFDISATESFFFRDKDKLFFSAWYEDEEYREEVIVRDITTGEILGTISGTIRLMPDDQKWILT